MNLKKITFISSIWISLVCNAGIWSSGGGSLIKRENNGEKSKPIFLDLAVKNPDFIDNYTSLDSYDNFKTSTGMYKRLRYEIADIKDFPSYTLLEKRIKVWKNNSPRIIEFVENSLEAVRFRYTKHYKAGKALRYYVSDKLRNQYPNLTVIPFIFYHENFGTIFNLNAWKELGIVSRAAALLHEALRQYQIEFEAEITDSNLQLLVGTIMMENPKRNRELDKVEFLGKYMTETVDPKIKKELCEVLKSTKQKAYSYHKKGAKNYNKVFLDSLFTSISYYACRGDLGEKFGYSEIADSILDIYDLINDNWLYENYLLFSYQDREFFHSKISTLTSISGRCDMYDLSNSLNEIQGSAQRLQNTVNYIDGNFGLSESAIRDHLNGKKVFKRRYYRTVNEVIDWYERVMENAVRNGILVETKIR